MIYQWQPWTQTFWEDDFPQCDLNKPEDFQIIFDYLMYYADDVGSLQEDFFTCSSSGIQCLLNQLNTIEDTQQTLKLWEIISRKILLPGIEKRYITPDKVMLLIKTILNVSFEHKKCFLIEMWQGLVSRMPTASNGEKIITRDIDAFIRAAASDCLPVKLKQYLFSESAFSEFQAMLLVPLPFSRISLFEKLYLPQLSEFIKDLNYIDDFSNEFMHVFCHSPALATLINSPDFPKDAAYIKEFILKLLPRDLSEDNLRLLYQTFLKSIHGNMDEVNGVLELANNLQQQKILAECMCLQVSFMTTDQKAKLKYSFLESAYHTALVLKIIACDPEHSTLKKVYQIILTTVRNIAYFSFIPQELSTHTNQILDALVDFRKKSIFIEEFVNAKYPPDECLDDGHFDDYLSVFKNHSACVRSIFSRGKNTGKIGSAVTQLNKVYQLLNKDEVGEFVRSISIKDEDIAHRFFLQEHIPLSADVVKNFNFRNVNKLKIQFLEKCLSIFSSTSVEAEDNKNLMRILAKNLISCPIESYIPKIKKCDVLVNIIWEVYYQDNTGRISSDIPTQIFLPLLPLLSSTYREECLKQLVAEVCSSLIFGRSSLGEKIVHEILPYLTHQQISEELLRHYAFFSSSVLSIQFLQKILSVFSLTGVEIQDKRNRHMMSILAKNLISRPMERYIPEIKKSDVFVNTIWQVYYQRHRRKTSWDRCEDPCPETFLPLLELLSITHRQQCIDQIILQVCSSVKSHFYSYRSYDVRYREKKIQTLYVIGPYLTHQQKDMLWRELLMANHPNLFTQLTYRFVLPPSKDPIPSMTDNDLYFLLKQDSICICSLKSKLLFSSSSKPYMPVLRDLPSNYKQEIEGNLAARKNFSEWGDDLKDQIVEAIKQQLYFSTESEKNPFLYIKDLANYQYSKFIQNMIAYIDLYLMSVLNLPQIYTDHALKYARIIPNQTYRDNVLKKNSFALLWLPHSVWEADRDECSPILLTYMDLLTADGLGWKKPMDVNHIAHVLLELHRQKYNVHTLLQEEPEHSQRLLDIMLEDDAFKEEWLTDKYIFSNDILLEWSQVQSYVNHNPGSAVSKKFATHTMSLALSAKTTTHDAAAQEHAVRMLAVLKENPKLIDAMHIADQKNLINYINLLIQDSKLRAVPVYMDFIKNTESKIKNVLMQGILSMVFAAVRRDINPDTMADLTDCLQELDGYLHTGGRRYILECMNNLISPNKQQSRDAKRYLEYFLSDIALTWIFACYAFNLDEHRSDFLETLYKNSTTQEEYPFSGHIDFIATSCQSFIKNTYVNVLFQKSQKRTFSFFQIGKSSKNAPSDFSEKNLPQAIPIAREKPHLDVRHVRMLPSAPSEHSEYVIEGGAVTALLIEDLSDVKQPSAPPLPSSDTTTTVVIENFGEDGGDTIMAEAVQASCEPNSFRSV